MGAAVERVFLGTVAIVIVVVACDSRVFGTRRREHGDGLSTVGRDRSGDRPAAVPGTAGGGRDHQPGADRAAQDLAETQGFRKEDYGLLPVRVDTWGGLVFVSLDPDASSAPLVRARFCQEWLEKIATEEEPWRGRFLARLPPALKEQILSATRVA